MKVGLPVCVWNCARSSCTRARAGGGVDVVYCARGWSTCMAPILVAYAVIVYPEDVVRDTDILRPCRTATVPLQGCILRSGYIPAQYANSAHAPPFPVPTPRRSRARRSRARRSALAVERDRAQVSGVSSA